MSPRTCSSTEQWEIIERVLASSLFERSARLRDFLRYVATEAIQNGATSIHEQQIGAAVFGRPAFYDTSQDNIVRVNATELRKRLELYFAGEGANDPLLFEIPRGTYIPLFRRRSDAIPDAQAAEHAVEEIPAAPPASLPELPRQRRPFSPGFAAVLCLLVITAGIALWEGVRVHELEVRLHLWRSRPSLREFWKNFLSSPNGTSVVLADTSFSVVQDLTGFRLTLNDYLNYHYQQEAEQLSGQPGADKVLHLLFTRTSGSLSDFRTAQAILNLEPASNLLYLHSAREFSGYASRHDSSILIGSSRSNPWVDLYKDKLDFSFIPANGPEDPVTISVRHARNGEPATYATAGPGNSRDGYCIIAFLDNLSGEGHTLIIAGTDSQATEAAGDFLTHETSMRELLRHAGTPLSHFQLLLHTTRVAGTPVASSIVAFHPVKD